MKRRGFLGRVAGLVGVVAVGRRVTVAEPPISIPAAVIDPWSGTTGTMTVGSTTGYPVTSWAPLSHYVVETPNEQSAMLHYDGNVWVWKG